MEHTHRLNELLGQARTLLTEDQQVTFIQHWFDGVFVQVMAITDLMAIWTIGTMEQGRLPFVSDNFDHAAIHFEALMSLQEMSF